MITSQCAIVEGELHFPLHDLYDERDSKNTYEVAGVSHYPSASAYTLVWCVTFRQNANNKLTYKLAIAIDKGCRKHKENCQQKQESSRECMWCGIQYPPFIIVAELELCIFMF